MEKPQALFLALVVTLVACGEVFVDANISKSMAFIWGAERATMSPDGNELELVMDTDSGSGIKSKREYLFGSIEMLIKFSPGNTAGTVTAYYLSSANDAHDEIDFEFLGNVTGQPYIIQTNVYTLGGGNREQQFYPWFDPTADYHNYTIQWTTSQIVWYVDSVPIRVFRNYENKGIPYPNKQGMRAYATLWNGEQWATRGGRDKIDWSSAPFRVGFRHYAGSACTWQGPASISQCRADNPDYWWNQNAIPYAKLNNHQILQMMRTRKQYMIYDYCEDVRHPTRPRPECFEKQY